MRKFWVSQPILMAISLFPTIANLIQCTQTNRTHQMLICRPKSIQNTRDLWKLFRFNSALFQEQSLISLFEWCRKFDQRIGLSNNSIIFYVKIISQKSFNGPCTKFAPILSRLRSIVPRHLLDVGGWMHLRKVLSRTQSDFDDLMERSRR